MTRRIAVLLFSALMVTSLATAQSSRDVTYNPRSVIRIDARLRMTTLVVLPEGEEILDFVCGDKDYWVVSGADNLAYIKPAKAGAVTNLNLVTASGHVYSFLLAEGAGEPDLKVFVTPDGSIRPATRAAAGITTAEIDNLKREISIAKSDAERTKREAEQAIHDSERSAQETLNTFRSTYPVLLQFPYVFKARTAPFKVTAIYHDDRFTYIRTQGRELPALYEVVDHAPNLVTYQVDQGVFIVPKILEHGYLAIGKKRLSFDTAVR
jgi:type IV secretory pathway VirB9-like protein